MAQLAQSFAEQLESIVRRYPTQWFNYFDFWAK
jgi:predicted LPLAT superfamily acyltransferase